MGLGIEPAIGALIVIQPLQQSPQLAGVFVDIDDVVHDLFPGRSSCFTVPMVELECQPYVGELGSNSSGKGGASAHSGVSGGKCAARSHVVLADS